MLDLVQPSLPLLDLERSEEPLARPSKRRPRKPALAAAPQTPATPIPSPCEAGERRTLRLAFLGLTARWALSGAEALTLLGEPLANELERLERVNALVALNRSLLLILPEPDRAVGYLRRPCTAFDDASPLQLMLAGGVPAIARVRTHLASKASL